MVHYNRLSYENKRSDKRCENCGFASAVKEWRHPNDTRTPYVVRCHRHPPIENDNQQHFFPQVPAGHLCPEWKADDGAERDDRGAPHHLRCTICQHSRAPGTICGLKPPASVDHEGVAVLTSVGSGGWCGDFELEEGVGRDAFGGDLPTCIRDLLAKARTRAA